jgi:hypothetical protein
VLLRSAPSHTLLGTRSPNPRRTHALPSAWVTEPSTHPCTPRGLGHRTLDAPMHSPRPGSPHPRRTRALPSAWSTNARRTHALASTWVNERSTQPRNRLRHGSTRPNCLIEDSMRTPIAQKSLTKRARARILISVGQALTIGDGRTSSRGAQQTGKRDATYGCVMPSRPTWSEEVQSGAPPALALTRSTGRRDPRAGSLPRSGSRGSLTDRRSCGPGGRRSIPSQRGQKENPCPL